MKRFFKNPSAKILKFSDFKDLDRDAWIYRVMPWYVLEFLRMYFRLEVEGIENVPARGGGIIAPNHSGFSGFDSFVLSHEIHRTLGRIPRTLAHHFWFLTKLTAVPAMKAGFIDANMNNALKQLQKKNLIVIFPEGEFGNFKPSVKRYHLQTFKRGFIRMALQEQVPIIPTLIIGAEETHINLTQVKLSKYLRGLVIPLPLNFIPLPAKWKIKFLEPIYLPYKPDAADDSELVHELASEIRESMQAALSREVALRDGVFTTQI